MPPVLVLPPAPPVPPVLVFPPAPPAPPVLGPPPDPPPPLVFPQVPTVDPGATKHSVPVQQSPLIVHEPPGGAHVPPVMQRSAPEASGTQGTSSQQSAAEAQLSPPTRQLLPSPLQRGTPSWSVSQMPPLAPSPPQQSARAEEMLHAYSFRWQTLPCGLHAPPSLGPLMGVRQIPMLLPAAIWQVTLP